MRVLFVFIIGYVFSGKKMEWIKIILPANTQGYRSHFSLWMFGALIILAVITPGLGGFLGNSQQATDLFSENRFRITIPSFSDIGAPPNPAFSSFMDGEFSLFGQNAAFGPSVSEGFTLLRPEMLAAILNGEALPTAETEKSGQKRTSKGPTSFFPIIHRAAAQYQIDPYLIRAIIFAESGYNPRAVSKKGAKGLMQLMPATAKAMGVEDCFNPEHNIFGGVKYFKKLFNRFDGDVTLALAAYNAGSRNVRVFNGVPPFKATEHYIRKVLKYYDIYKSQEAGSVELT